MWATGACMMVRSSAYRDLGGLDERFFAHMEEIDLCWRMQLAGYRVTIVPESLVYHVGGGTLPASSPFKLFLNYRNNLLMLENNLAKTYALKFFNKGMSAENAARKGVQKARCRISQRKVLDWISAFIYLLTFKKDSFNAVQKAYKEYHTLAKPIDVQNITDHMACYGPNVSVKGIYNKSIILQSFLKGKDVFRSIDL